MTKTTRHPEKKAAKKKGTNTRKWSARVNASSDALDLEGGIFRSEDPAAIARLLKRSAVQSHRRKGTPFQSAMSMLNFYINRAGDQLTKKHEAVLEKAKNELRKLFGRKEE